METELYRKLGLKDLSDSTTMILKLPPPLRKFTGSVSNSKYGPVNAGGMSSAIATYAPMGNLAYGAGVYGESVQIFKKFLESLTINDSLLMESIIDGFNICFSEVKS